MILPARLAPIFLFGLFSGRRGPRPASPAPGAPPPRSWIDPDTGHRVIRLTDEPGSASLYFNDNGYTPDGSEMIYTTTADGGISVVNLRTYATHPVVPGPVRAICVGQKTPSVFYLKTEGAAQVLYSTNLDTGETRRLATMPPRGSVVTINADETLAAGTYLIGDAPDFGGRGAAPAAGTQTHPLEQAANKGQMMAARLAARLPLVLFTIDLRTGKEQPVLASTDWVSHLEFSPTDPTLLMYCHEGQWWKVDRIWTIRTDGTHNTLVHQRTMGNEIAGHEFWAPDGKTIWYDLQLPIGEVFYLSGYAVATGERTWYHLERNEWSIHFNVTRDGTLVCGDGGDPGQVAKAKDGEWIYLFHPRRLNDAATLGEHLIHSGVLDAEKLVNMSRHNYKLEPNVSFSPDQKLVIFRSNMFGATYVFGVEVAKAAPAAP